MCLYHFQRFLSRRRSSTSGISSYPFSFCLWGYRVNFLIGKFGRINGAYFACLCLSCRLHAETMWGMRWGGVDWVVFTPGKVFFNVGFRWQSHLAFTERKFIFQLSFISNRVTFCPLSPILFIVFPNLFWAWIEKKDAVFIVLL